MGVGADAPGGRTAELLKVAASGRGVVTSSGAWTWSSGERGRRLSGVERRVVSDNAATDGGRWRSARSDDASTLLEKGCYHYTLPSVGSS